jgi:hypothetical protein
MARGYSQSKSELNTDYGRENQLLKEDLPRNPIMKTTVEQERDYWPMIRKFYADEAKAIDKEYKPMVAKVKKLPADERIKVMGAIERLQDLVGQHVKRYMSDINEGQAGNLVEINRADTLKQRIVERVEQLPEWVRSTMYAPADKIGELSRGADRPTLTTVESGGNIGSFTDSPTQAANFGKGTGTYGIQRFYTAKDIDSFDKIIDLQRVARFAYAFSANEENDFIKETIRDEREYLVTNIKWKESTLKEQIGTERSKATI